VTPHDFGSFPFHVVAFNTGLPFGKNFDHKSRMIAISPVMSVAPTDFNSKRNTLPLAIARILS
jgi:hypothetical protein